MHETLKTLKSYLSLAVQIIAIFVVLINLYLASKLAPLTQDIRNLFQRVQAVEETAVRKDVLTETLEPMKKDISDIKEKSGETRDDVATIKGILQR